MKIDSFYALGLIFILLFSCSEKTKKEKEKVHYIDSPAAINTSLPYLFSSNEKTLLSLVEI